jgi:hypothetical protein
MRILLSGLVVSSLIGCATSDQEQPEPSDTHDLQVGETTQASQVPSSSGSWIGHYQVPTSASLSSAASFAVPEVKWTVVSGVATLHYDLPVGLVGGDVSVTLSGSMTSGGATTLMLTTGSGTGACTASGNIVTCSETFGNLGTLPVNPAVVTTMATQDNIAPASRAAVAASFGIDPIGTVTFDLSQPSGDDSGGNGGGHGGSGGGGNGGHGHDD